MDNPEYFQPPLEEDAPGKLVKPPVPPKPTNIRAWRSRSLKEHNDDAATISGGKDEETILKGEEGGNPELSRSRSVTRGVDVVGKVKKMEERTYQEPIKPAIVAPKNGTETEVKSIAKPKKRVAFRSRSVSTGSSPSSPKMPATTSLVRVSMSEIPAPQPPMVVSAAEARRKSLQELRREFFEGKKAANHATTTEDAGIPAKSPDEGELNEVSSPTEKPIPSPRSKSSPVRPPRRASPRSGASPTPPPRTQSPSVRAKKDGDGDVEVNVVRKNVVIGQSQGPEPVTLEEAVGSEDEGADEVKKYSGPELEAKDEKKVGKLKNYIPTGLKLSIPI